MSKQEAAVIPGVTMRYSGQIIDSRTGATSPTDSGHPITPYFRFVMTFACVGALLQRYQNAVVRKSVLIQQVASPDNENVLANNPGSAKEKYEVDNNALFEVDATAHLAFQQTQLLERLAHLTVGSSYVATRRGHPVIQKTGQSEGELGIFDIMHTVVWGVGISLASHLQKQGFYYVEHAVSESLTDAVQAELYDGKFEIHQGGAEYYLKTQSGYKLSVKNITALEIKLDPQHAVTKKAHGFAIATKGGAARPMGWFIHLSHKKVVDAYVTESLFRTMQTAKQGFLRLTPSERALLTTGLQETKEEVTLAQNRSFNSLYYVMHHLNKSFGFDPSALTQDASARAAGNLQKHFLETEISEDFLVGAIIAEMVEPLAAIQPGTQRQTMAERFSVPFFESYNTTLAIAYAFNLTNSDGAPLFIPHTESKAVSYDSRLTDARVNGYLRSPKFDQGKHLSAVLSSTIMVVEQILFEKVFPLEVLSSSVNELKMLLNDSQYATLDLMMQKVGEISAPKLGLQFSGCQDVVALMRQCFSHDKLIHFAHDVETLAGIQLDEYLQQHENEIADSLGLLYKTVEYLDGVNRLLTERLGSRGVLPGLSLLLQRLLPERYNDIVQNNVSLPSPRDARGFLCQGGEVPAHSSPRNQAEEMTAAMCPYALFDAKRPAPDNLPVRETTASSADVIKDLTWPQWFGQKAMQAAPYAIAGVVSAVVVNQMK